MQAISCCVRAVFAGLCRLWHEHRHQATVDLHFVGIFSALFPLSGRGRKWMRCQMPTIILAIRACVCGHAPLVSFSKWQKFCRGWRIRNAYHIKTNEWNVQSYSHSFHSIFFHCSYFVIFRFCVRKYEWRFVSFLSFFSFVRSFHLWSVSSESGGKTKEIKMENWD